MLTRPVAAWGIITLCSICASKGPCVLCSSIFYDLSFMCMSCVQSTGRCVGDLGSSGVPDPHQSFGVLENRAERKGWAVADGNCGAAGNRYMQSYNMP
ncbi:hypothetical protein SEVIR_3G344401v4 [Setaria viridis]